MLRRLLDKWDSFKSKYVIVACLFVLKDISDFTQFIKGLFSWVVTMINTMHLQSISDFTNQSWFKVLVDVLIVLLFRGLERSIAKTKQEIVSDQNLLMRLSALQSKQVSGIISGFQLSDWYLYDVAKEFTPKEIKRLKELKAIPQDYDPEKYRVS